MEDSVAKKWTGAGLFILIVLAVVAGILFAVRKPALNIDVLGVRCLSPPVKISPFTLIDQNGQVFDSITLSGSWTLAVIGYTYCPDVCPTALREMSSFFKQYNRSKENLKAPRFVFFSVDPFRDTPEVLKEYMNYFSKDFIGLTGKPEVVDKVVKNLGLFYTYEDSKGAFIRDLLHKPSDDGYSVIHYSGLLFISPKVELVATMQPPFEADSVLTVFQSLRSYYGE